MQDNHRKISLGFTSRQFPPGVHICHFFSDDNERRQSFADFILSGLQSRERISCFTDNETDQAIEAFLHPCGISYKKIRDAGAINLAGTKDTYFSGNCFNPEQMLGRLREYYWESVMMGYPAVRMIGEMAPEVQQIPGGSRLLEYESKITLMQLECPVTTVCQYDARLFNGAAIMDILKVHPLMLIRGSVIHNPFFIQPERFMFHRGRRH